VSFVTIYVAGRMVHRMLFLDRNFVSGPLCTLKPKIPKIYSKNLGFFPALV